MRSKYFLIGAVLAVSVLTIAPQKSNAQYFFGGGRVGVGVRVGVGSPFYGRNFGGYGLYNGFGGMGYRGLNYGLGSSYAFAYARSYAPAYYPRTVYAPGVALPAIPAPPPLPITQPENGATIQVVCPREAYLWFNDYQSKMIGKNRTFVTPALGEGQHFYDIKAVWRNAEGKEVSLTRQVEVFPNQTAYVNFVDEPLPDPRKKDG